MAVEAKRNASIQITSSAAGMDRGLGDARRKLRTFERETSRGVSRMVGTGAKMRRLGEGISGGIGAGLGFLGVGGILDAAQGVRDFERSLMRLGVEAGMPNDKLNALRATMTKLSSRTGISRDDIVAAGNEYFALTSDVEGMDAALATFARTAQASGASAADITKLGAALLNAGVSAAEMESAMSGLIAQGSAGKITLAESAKEFVSLLPKFQKFNGGAKGRDSVMQMSAAYQTLADDFGTGSEAATGLENMLAMLQARQKHLAKAGVHVFDGKGELNNLDSILGEIKSKLGDRRKWGDMFGENQQGRSALEALLGRLEGKYQDVRRAGENTTEVATRFGRVMESSSGKIDKAINAAKIAISEAFTPERIEKFARALGVAAEYFADIVGYAERAVNFIDSMRGDNMQSEIMVGANKNAVAGMTPEQRKTTLGKRALDLASDPDAGVGGMKAARALAKEAGILLPQDDSWGAGQRTPVQRAVAGSQFNPAQFDPNAFMRAIKEAFRTIPIIVKIDSTAANEKLGNSQTHRRGH